MGAAGAYLVCCTMEKKDREGRRGPQPGGADGGRERLPGHRNSKDGLKTTQKTKLQAAAGVVVTVTRDTQGCIKTEQIKI